MATKLEIINHPRGQVEKRLIDDTPRSEYKAIGLDELEELIPDSVLVELETIKYDETLTDAKRAAATRALNKMKRGDKVDVYSAKFTTFMTKLVNNTALTGTQAVAIVDILKGQCEDNQELRAGYF